MSGKNEKQKRKIRKLLDSLELDNYNFLVDKYPSLVLNKQFSRLETPRSHYYIKQWKPNPETLNRCSGRLKCKLMHGNGFSIIVPDQIYIQHDSQWRWIQPFAFGPNICFESDVDSVCQISVDISAGESIKVRFMGNPPLAVFEDGSHLYECDVFGPCDLTSHTTGDAYFDEHENPFLRLFHHTTKNIRPKIVKSGHLLASDCNIQGTTKRMVNVAYAYFTPLTSIKTNDDLKKIAMSGDSKIHLRRDGCRLPEILTPQDVENYPSDILELEVYPSDPKKRESSIPFWVDATILAPQHIYRHAVPGDPVFYEIPHEFIQRVGLLPGETLSFDTNSRITRGPGLKQFDYVVVGDCTSLDGLAAPYDEENTKHVLKLERVTNGESFVEFWFSNKNVDHFSGKSPEMQEFR